jgi:xanthine dehydrogenase accessory factor
MNFSPELLQKLAEVKSQPGSTYLATVIKVQGSTPRKVGAKMIISGSGEIWGTIGGGDVERKLVEDVNRSRPRETVIIRYDLTENRDAAKDPDMMCGGIMEFLIEPLTNSDELFIVGAGHCGMELSRLAHHVGFAVTVIDNRSEWATREKHPEADQVICTDYATVAELIRFSPDAYIVIMTHGHEHDEAVLKLCLGHEAKYLGMIGSRSKAARIRRELAEAGISAERLARVHTPLGLDIGSHTPAEIAVSIVAELIAVRNQLQPLS